MKKNRTLILLLPLVAVLFIAVAYEYGYLGVQTELSSIKEEQEIKSRTLMKYMAAIERKPKMENILARLKERRKAEDSKLFEGQTITVAAAALQESVKGIVTSRGGKIFSERVGKPEAFGKFMLITASLDVTLPDVKALSDILYSIETRIPYLVVREVDIRIKTFNNPKEMSVKLDIAALAGKK